MGEKTDINTYRWIRKAGMGIAVLLMLLFIITIISIAVGSVPIPVRTELKILSAHVFGGEIPSDITKFDDIIFKLRLPRIILAIIVGFLLAAAGTALQGLLLNPLADPYTVGVSSGAALGAALAMIIPGFVGLFFGFGVPVVAFLFACGAMLIVHSLSRFGGRISMHSFLLAGVVVGSFLWSVLTFILTLAQEDLSAIVHWLLGSFADKPWAYVVMILPFGIIGFTVLYALARDMNIFSLGEETARNIGIETENFKLIIIATTSMMTAAAVSVSGIIGFVGLIVPHISRRIFGSDNRVLIPTAAISGSILMVLADTAARLLGELPVGVITAMIGAPLFLYLLRRQPRRG